MCGIGIITSNSSTIQECGISYVNSKIKTDCCMWWDSTDEEMLENDCTSNTTECTVCGGDILCKIMNITVYTSRTNCQNLVNSVYFEITSNSNFFDFITAKLIDLDHSFSICPLPFGECFGTECNPSNSTIQSNKTSPFQPGCEPFCGVCRTGYSCDQGGFCVKNSRST
ncbi:hypothetical protein QTN25_008868 [Entamoeba marina]